MTTNNNTKSSVNAVVSISLYKDPNRYRELYMDNCYSVQELLMIFKSQYKTLACRTIHTN